MSRETGQTLVCSEEDVGGRIRGSDLWAWIQMVALNLCFHKLETLVVDVTLSGLTASSIRTALTMHVYSEIQNLIKTLGHLT